MLVVDVNKRASLEDIRKDVWFNDGSSTQLQRCSSNEDGEGCAMLSQHKVLIEKIPSCEEFLQGKGANDPNYIALLQTQHHDLEQDISAAPKPKKKKKKLWKRLFLLSLFKDKDPNHPPPPPSRDPSLDYLS
jgi:hypothetical protein